MDYIPLVTDDFRVTFCRVTKSLCPDVQCIIWRKLLYEDIKLTTPSTPQKCRIKYSRVFGNSLPRNLLNTLHVNHL